MDTTAPLTLENDVLLARFDAITGALIALQSKLSGWDVLRRPELGLSFLIELPLPERHMNYIYGTRQQLSECTVSDDGTSLTFVWKHLRSEHGGDHAMTFTGTVMLGEEGLTFDGQLDNHAEYTAEAVCYPCLGDITPAQPGEKLERLSGDYCNLVRATLSPEFQNNRGYWGCDDLGNNGAFSHLSLFSLLAHPTQGWYVGVRDTSMREMVDFFYRFRPGRVDSYAGILPATDTFAGHTVARELFVVHYPYVHPGESARLAPIVFHPYQGSWHRGVDRYTTWRADWFVRPRTPHWASEPHAWLQFQMNGAEDDLRYRYTDLVEIGRECAEQGVKAIQLVGWNNGGQDRGNPSHDTDPRLGTWEELRAAIAAVQAMGVQMILFSKFTWGDRSQPWFRETGHRFATKDPYGDAHVYGGYQYQTFVQSADINTRRFSPMCQLSPEWREVAADEFSKLLDLGAAGMLYDECQHHGPAKYCFDPTHGHHVPAYVFGGDIPLMDRFLQISRERNPDFLYAGEACYDLEYLRYHLSYFRIGNGAQPLARYVDPFAPMMVAVTGFDDRNQLNKCLQHRYIISYEPFNFHGRLRDFPSTVAYGKLIDVLRTRYRAYLWDAEYADIVGAAASMEGQAYSDFTVYTQLNTGKRAIVIANTKNDQAINVTFAFDGAARGTHMLVTPEAPEMQPTGDTVNIPARSLAVIMEV
jgi:hypothetical protein